MNTEALFCFFANDLKTNVVHCQKIDGEGEVQVCSGHGACDCGVCACDDGFIGRHCEKCVVSINPSFALS